MMEYKDILYQKDGGVVRLVLNRPEKRNALSVRMFDEIISAVGQAEQDDEIKVIILKGAGKGFCAGHDLTEAGLSAEKGGTGHGFGNGTTAEERRRPSLRSRLKADAKWAEEWRRLLFAQKPLIAQVHGFAMEAAIYLICVSDLAVMAEDTKIGHLGQRFGFGGHSFLMPLEFYLMGPRVATELLLTGRLMDGKEAERVGLANKAVPLDKLEEEVNKLARAICLIPRDGIVMGKMFRQQAYDTMGIFSGLIDGFLGHTLFTNLRFEPDDYNFLKARRDGGLKEALKKRDERFKGLV